MAEKSTGDAEQDRQVEVRCANAKQFRADQAPHLQPRPLTPHPCPYLRPRPAIPKMWKVKKLIKSLQAARGNGTSMISLVIPPKDQVSRVNKMLTDEYGTASNIKSRVNRLSVLGAITSAQQRLKLYSRVPDNGLVLYCGTILTDDGKEKRVNIDFEPFKPINTSLYLCDNKFHTEVRRRGCDFSGALPLLSALTRLPPLFSHFYTTPGPQ